MLISCQSLDGKSALATGSFGAYWYSRYKCNFDSLGAISSRLHTSLNDFLEKITNEILK
jgi:hypothetical protein